MENWIIEQTSQKRSADRAIGDFFAPISFHMSPSDSDQVGNNPRAFLRLEKE